MVVLSQHEVCAIVVAAGDTFVSLPVVPRSCLSSRSKLPFSTSALFLSWTSPRTLASAACSFSLQIHQNAEQQA